MAFAEIIGPEAPYRSPSVCIGLTLIGPGTLYPLHLHPAIELYLVAAGTAIWSRMEFPVGIRRALSFFILHKSLTPRKRTKSPIVAVYFVERRGRENPLHLHLIRTHWRSRGSCLWMRWIGKGLAGRPQTGGRASLRSRNRHLGSYDPGWIVGSPEVMEISPTSLMQTYSVASRALSAGAAED